MRLEGKADKGTLLRRSLELSFLFFSDDVIDGPRKMPGTGKSESLSGPAISPAQRSRRLSAVNLISRGGVTEP